MNSYKNKPEFKNDELPWLDNWQVDQLEQFIQLRLLRFKLEISGTPSSGVKPATPTTPESTPGMVTTELFNSLLAHGRVLEELDIHINILTKYRERLQKSYSNVLDGVNGLNAPAPLSSDPLNNAPEQGTSGGKAQWRCHCGDTSGCRPGHCLNVPA